MVIKAGVFALGALLLAGAAGAQQPDELIPGQILFVKRANTGPTDGPTGSARPSVVRFVAKAPRRSSFELPATDLRESGATLRVFDIGGEGNDTYELPAEGWKGLGNPPGARGYRYKGVGTFVAPHAPGCYRPGRLRESHPGNLGKCEACPVGGVCVRRQ